MAFKKPKIKKVNGKALLEKAVPIKETKSARTLTPYPPPNPVVDLVALHESVQVEKGKPFASRYLTSEELEGLRTEEKRKGLTSEEKIVILEMSIADLGPSIIAARINRNTQTVKNFLSKYRSRGILGRAYLESKAETLAKRVVENANVEETLEVLDRLDVLAKKRAEGSSSNTQFNVIVGVPGASAGPIPIPVPSQAQIEAAKEE